MDRFPGAALVEAVGTPSVRRSAGLAVHNVVVAVEGPEGGARQAIFDAIDKAYLKSRYKATVARGRGVKGLVPNGVAQAKPDDVPPTVCL
ncbi:MAG: hypothetical protein U0361_17405 [Nitrospiraceae bacterium]